MRPLKAKLTSLPPVMPTKPQFFVDKLAQGVAMIAAAFYPKDVILRLSDFKTNEYANLIGGHPYEPEEENPMIGFRGASRYYNPRYQRGFALECAAVKKVRDEMGLKNLKLMVPFCRTVEEGRLVQAEMEKHGLKRGEDGLEIYVMCEIPSNVILANEFAEIFDGFSIGSNDLTQLILGVDRDSEIVAHVFDERNAAVKTMIAQVIATCRAKGRKIGICGQAPSDYPEFAQFLVEQGIDSISLNPDTVLKTTVAIVEKEYSFNRRKQRSERTMNPVHLHLMLNHVPVLGSVFGLLLLGAALLRKSRELQKVSLAVCVIAAAVAIPVYFTGEPAEERIEHLPGVAKAIIEEHEEAAVVALASILALGAVAAAGLIVFRGQRSIPRWFVNASLIMALVTVGLMLRTANLGGKVRHTEIRGDVSSEQASVRSHDSEH